MGTRCGDIDPGLFQFLANQNKMSVAEITNMLNSESGLLGISQLSSDCRTLEDIQEENSMADLALNMFAYIAAKNIAALAVNLDNIDALIFCGGIGENSSYLRKKIIQQLKILNFHINDDANNITIKGKQGVISANNSNSIMVIPTDESLMIATDVTQLLSSNNKT
jgi:acetate kinase